MFPTQFLTKLQITHEKVTKGPAQIQLVRELEFGIGQIRCWHIRVSPSWGLHACNLEPWAQYNHGEAQIKVVAGLPIQVRKLENPAFYPKRALYFIIFLFPCTDILTEGTAQEQFALAADISIWRHIKRLIRVLEFFFIWRQLNYAAGCLRAYVR